MGTMLNQINWKSLLAVVAGVLAWVDPGHGLSTTLQAIFAAGSALFLAVDHGVSAYIEGVHTKAVTGSTTTTTTTKAATVSPEEKLMEALQAALSHATSTSDTGTTTTTSGVRTTSA